MKLFPHQIEAIESLQTGNILRGGVGSGKSLTALAYYYTKINGGVINDWDCNNKINGERNIRLYIITTASKRNKGEWTGDCLPLGIEPVAIDSWNNIRKYENISGAFFIFDEQKTSGGGSWSKTFIKICKRNRWLLLSATPGDTWIDYVSVFIANGFYTNKSQFLREHAVFSRFSKYPKIERFVNEEILVKYRSAITRIMLDRRQTTRVVRKTICKYDKASYATVNTKRWNVEENRPIETANEMCLLLRKICNGDNSRVQALYDIYEIHKRLIVFYSFNYELRKLEDLCREKGIKYGQYNGHQHDKVPTSKAWMYFVQYTAGAEGWNCITTDTTVFYSLPYSYKQLEQAMGRIDRINTPFYELNYYQLVTESEIDRKILMALDNKQIFNEKDFVKF